MKITYTLKLRQRTERRASFEEPEIVLDSFNAYIEDVAYEYCCETMRERDPFTLERRDFKTLAIAYGKPITEYRCGDDEFVGIVPVKFCPWCAAPVTLECRKTIRERALIRERVVKAQTIEIPEKRVKEVYRVTTEE